MGVDLSLTAPAANMDPPMDPPVKTGDYVVSDPCTVTTLALGFQSLRYKVETGTTPTIPGHGLVHLDKVVDQPTFTSLLRSGRQVRHAFESTQRLSQIPKQQSLFPLFPFANLLLQCGYCVSLPSFPPTILTLWSLAKFWVHLHIRVPHRGFETHII